MHIPVFLSPGGGLRFVVHVVSDWTCTYCQRTVRKWLVPRHPHGTQQYVILAFLPPRKMSTVQYFVMAAVGHGRCLPCMLETVFGLNQLFFLDVLVASLGPG